jgi:NodT family efflux transporter outer membrane factor (OMF) lipoprotein
MPATRLDASTRFCSATILRQLAFAGWFAPPLVLLSCCAGCMVGPDYHRPAPTTMPASWSAQSPAEFATSQPTTQSTTTSEPIQIVSWWQSFNDPELDSMVDRALQANLDLRQAEERIRQARAQRGVVAADFWPNVNSSASYRRSFTGSAGFANGNAVNTGSSPSERDLYQAGFDAVWELDVFGGIRRNMQAADADIAAAREDHRSVMVTLLGEVARNYVELRGFQQQIIIAHENLAAQRQTADVTRRRQAGGFSAGLDVANAEALVASTQSQIPALESQARQTIYTLSVLLGQEPTALADELSASAPIPVTPPEIPIGLPSELLRRRPDIRRAERQLAAATARIGVATADLFPKFSLTGSLGLQGNTFQSLSNWDSRFWSIGPSVSWPVFDAGRIFSNIDVQNSIQRQALTAYQQSVLTALQEVESSLTAYSKEQQRLAALADAVAANRRAVDISTRLYTQGLTDFLNVLVAQRSLFASQDALVQSQSSVSTNLVAVYKALGGGWEQRAAELQSGPAN